MPILSEATQSLNLPKMYAVKQNFDRDAIDDLPPYISNLFVEQFSDNEFDGKRIALAVGSRGIDRIDVIVKALVDEIKKRGGHPFIVPSMGSHGSASAQGQVDVLNGYGISETRMGVEILSSMEVIKIGETNKGIPVFIDKYAFEADLIVPVGRIKPHTDFNGEVESGLCKMLAIGLGKHVGCSRLHQEGFESFSTLIPEIAKIMIDKAKIIFGVAIIENAYDKTHLIELVSATDILEREPSLLKIAKKMMPSIKVKEIDVLIISEIGKEISGAGADPNIIGRTTKGIKGGYQGPKIQRIVILGLSKKTNGNACGIGLADFSLSSLLDNINYESTYANVIASGNPEAGRIPVLFDDETEAIKAAVSCCTQINYSSPRIVKIKNTLDLESIEVSDNLLEEIMLNNKS